MLVNAILMLAIMTMITGVVYPLVVTGIARLLYPVESQGSLIFREGKVVGSALIGQPFQRPQYFWGRPSATSPMPYNAASSSGSNLGPLNPELLKRAESRLCELRTADPDLKAVPVDLVTTSGSGLDPHISPEAAEVQVARVAASRGRSMNDIRELVRRHTEGRQWGLLGMPRVNVLLLNLSLDDAEIPPPENAANEATMRP
jgi:K+-transporting ATPase ATPase C chain